MEKNKKEFLEDYFKFEFIDNPDDPNDGLIQIDIKPKGQEFLDSKSAGDPKFDSDEYLKNLVITALQSYIDKSEKAQSGEIDEDNKG